MQSQGNAKAKNWITVASEARQSMSAEEKAKTKGFWITVKVVFRLCEEQRDEAIQQKRLKLQEKQKIKDTGSLRQKDGSRRRENMTPFRSPWRAQLVGIASPKRRAKRTGFAMLAKTKNNFHGNPVRHSPWIHR